MPAATIDIPNASRDEAAPGSTVIAVASRLVGALVPA
jgi:hypothetical protein